MVGGGGGGGGGVMAHDETVSVCLAAKCLPATRKGKPNKIFRVSLEP